MPLDALDRALFTAPYILITADNDGTGTARDLRDARAAMRLGKASTAAGTLRAGILAADLDPHSGDPILGDACAEILIRWCVENSLPYLVRESGRPGGRHVLAIAAEPHHQRQWNTLCRSLARRYRIPIDDRTGKALRLLTAPHRRGLAAPVIGATMTPQRVLDVRPPSTSRRIRARVSDRRSPGAWRGPRDRSRSGREYGLACAMARAGYTTAQAWNHRDFAGGKSGQRGELWWRRYLWMPAVTTVAAEQGATAEQAWHRAQRAAPLACRKLTRDGWLGLWHRAVAEARTDRPRRYRIDSALCTPHLTTEIDTLRDGLLSAARAAPTIRRRRPQLRHSVAAVLHALAPALARRGGAISVRSLARNARLDPKTVSTALGVVDAAGVVVLARTFEHGVTPSHLYRTGPAAQEHIRRARDRTSTNSCSTPFPFGRCDTERLDHRLRLDRAHWLAATPTRSNSPEAKVLRSYRFQRAWWNSRTPSERHLRRRVRRRVLRDLDDTALPRWLAWLRRRERIAQAAENAIAANATHRDWTTLATAPPTLHHGMRHLQWLLHDHQQHRSAPESTGKQRIPGGACESCAEAVKLGDSAHCPAANGPVVW